jgi:hypothetical protein
LSHFGLVLIFIVFILLIEKVENKKGGVWTGFTIPLPIPPVLAPNAILFIVCFFLINYLRIWKIRYFFSIN